jgi:hypothetical protein
MSDSIAVSAEYRELLDSVKQTIAAGRLRAARAVNTILVGPLTGLRDDTPGSVPVVGGGGR